MDSELRYERILAAFLGSACAILESKWHEIYTFLVFAANGGSYSAEQVQKIVAANRPQARAVNQIAILPLFGTLSGRQNLLTETSGGTSVEKFGKQFQALIDDPGVAGIVLDVDSPGGSVDQVPEVADQIYRSRGSKPILASANSLAASGAYWLGSAADSLHVTPSGQVGSIGVFAAHVDESVAQEKRGVKVTLIHAGRYKVEGNPYEPLTDEARTKVQQDVDHYYNLFTSDVARYRGVSVDAVRNGYGEGRVVTAPEAKRLGMADSIATLSEVVDMAARRVRQSQRNRAELDLRQRKLRAIAR